MKMNATEVTGFKQTLDRTAAELVRVLRNRDGLAVEKSADEMDQIQNATERDLAMRNIDRDSILLRNVRAAIQRIDDGSFGICVDCDSAIGAKRLAAVPYAPRCIRCQETSDRERQTQTHPQILDDAA